MDIDSAELLAGLFRLEVGSYYIALAGEKDSSHVLAIIAKIKARVAGTSLAEDILGGR
jgi:hypothetical protein